MIQPPPSSKDYFKTLSPEIRRKIFIDALENTPDAYQELFSGFSFGPDNRISIQESISRPGKFINVIDAGGTITYRRNGCNVVQKAIILSRVCKIFHEEIMEEGLIYRSHEFEFRSAKLACSFLGRIRPRHLNLIKEVKIKILVKGDENTEVSRCFDILASCKSLKKLDLSVMVHNEMCKLLGFSPVLGTEWDIPDKALDILRVGLKGRLEGLKKLVLIVLVQNDTTNLGYNIVCRYGPSPTTYSRGYYYRGDERFRKLYNELSGHGAEC